MSRGGTTSLRLVTGPGDQGPRPRGRDRVPGAAWVWLSIAAGALAAAGSVAALALPRVYARLTPAFLPQALAQDVANVAVAAPALLVLAALTLRGSTRARLLWLGVLTFTVYNYVIYAFSIPFGPLFLPWVAVLGASLFALVGGLASLNADAVAADFADRRAVVATALALIGTALLFGLLWLAEDVPALLAGRAPASLADLALPTNPVHVLDLGFFLPAAVGTGIALLRRRPLAHALAPAFIVFLVLTGVPILLTPVVQAARGGTPAWGVWAPIGTLTVLLLALLAWLMATLREGARAPGD